MLLDGTGDDFTGEATGEVIGEGAREVVAKELSSLSCDLVGVDLETELKYLNYLRCYQMLQLKTEIIPFLGVDLFDFDIFQPTDRRDTNTDSA